MARRNRRLPGPELHVRAEFRAPLDYVFAWCTDYTPQDARWEKERYQRRVLDRGPRRVVFEDLDEAGGGGWWWTHYTVDLRPPRRWSADAIGSHRSVHADYELTALDPERTRLDLRWRRQPTGIESKRTSRRQVERSTARAWRNFAAALERDYRAGHRPA